MTQTMKTKYIYVGNIMKLIDGNVQVYQENAILFKVGSSYINFDLKNIDNWMDFLGSVSFHVKKIGVTPINNNCLFVDELSLKSYEEKFYYDINSYVVNEDIYSCENNLWNRFNQELSSCEVKRSR